jgi:hypothetical protein
MLISSVLYRNIWNQRSPLNFDAWTLLGHFLAPIARVGQAREGDRRAEALDHQSQARDDHAEEARAPEKGVTQTGLGSRRQLAS